MSAQLRDQTTRDHLLEIGAEAIAAKSFAGCGLAEILERAGVPKGSFYHYFPSKEDFGIALIEKEAAGWLEKVRPIAGDRRHTPVARLRAVFEMVRDECSANGPARPCLVQKLALEISQLSEPVQAAVRCAYKQWHALLAQMILEAQSAGEVSRSREAELLASLLATAWEGAMLRTQVENSVQAMDELLEFTFETLLARD